MILVFLPSIQNGLVQSGSVCRSCDEVWSGALMAQSCLQAAVSVCQAAEFVPAPEKHHSENKMHIQANLCCHDERRLLSAILNPNRPL